MNNLSRATFVLVLLGNAFPFFLKAANPLEVVINEIAWTGTQVEGVESKNWWRYEWLELYNNTSQVIPLAGWQLELWRTSLDWSLELKGTILPQSYFLIVSSDKIFPNFDLNYANLDGKFVNSGEQVILKDAEGNTIDSLDCFSFGKWFAGENQTKQTMERINPRLTGNQADNWGTSQNPGGTPKAKNSLFSDINLEPSPAGAQVKPAETKSPPDYPSGIMLNEILPSPEGPDEENEWIEIFNQNGFEVNLSGWKIADQAGVIKTYIFPTETKILAQGFLVFSRPITKITLNNNDDGLNLIRPDGKVIDSIAYEKAPLNQSYNRTESGWSWSDTLTPGAPNLNLASLSGESEINPPVEEIKNKVSNFPSKPEIAAIGPQIPTESANYLLVLIMALSNAVFSGIIILFIKRKMKSKV